jgi:hypothetical protein
MKSPKIKEIFPMPGDLEYDSIGRRHYGIVLDVSKTVICCSEDMLRDYPKFSRLVQAEFGVDLIRKEWEPHLEEVISKQKKSRQPFG